MDGKVIAVTGASRGIGAAIAMELARRGFVVACLSRKGLGVEVREGVGQEQADARDDVQADAQAALSSRLVPVACDVDDEASVASALAVVVERCGRLDGLVNNAGIHRTAKTAEMSTELYDSVMGTNARAVFVVCREAYPYLSRGGGTIVNIGSFFDRLGVKANLAYCASKAAVAAMTRCLAVEWAPKGIRALNVAPGYIETELNAPAMREGPLRTYLDGRIPMRRPGRADEVARVVASLFSEDVAFLTGETIYVDGGQAIAH